MMELLAFLISVKFWSGVVVGHFFGPPIWRGVKWAFNWVKKKVNA